MCTRSPHNVCLQEKSTYLEPTYVCRALLLGLREALAVPIASQMLTVFTLLNIHDADYLRDSVLFAK